MVGIFINTLILLMSAGLAVSGFTAVALVVAPAERRMDDTSFPSYAWQASLLFLKDLVEETGGPGWADDIPDLHELPLRLPSLYLFMRTTYEEPGAARFFTTFPPLRMCRVLQF